MEQAAGTLLASYGLWRSLVARLVRDEEVVGSNPAYPTKGSFTAPAGRLP